MKRLYVLAFLLVMCASFADAQRKMSPYLQRMADTHVSDRKKALQPSSVFVFVKADDEQTLLQHGCQIYAQWDDLFIAQVPLNHLQLLAKEKNVHRIEANEPMSLCNDTTSAVLGVKKARQGTSPLQQAFTGKDVVVGVMDVGFDFTHPTFSDRISYFWDMLGKTEASSVSVRSEELGVRSKDLPFGREYYGNENIKPLQHSVDGEMCTHGTHTTGTAAGNGYQGKYPGMAPESDIALVCNVCSDNSVFADSALRTIYTDVVDVLGFKRIFDYAESQGKPCVINFSQGSMEDPYNDGLYYEALDKITGPGKILVISAGNHNLERSYAHKPAATKSISLTVNEKKKYILYYIQTDGPVTNHLKIAGNDMCWTTSDIIACEDSTLRDTIYINGYNYAVSVSLYHDSYGKNKTIYEVMLQNMYGAKMTLAPEITIEGNGVEAEIYLHSGTFAEGFGEYGHNIDFPAASPSVISVGANGYREHVYNYKGEFKQHYIEQYGMVSCYSSEGPTMAGLLKPETIAPGNDIISSYNSFYLEHHPNANDIKWDVEHFEYNGRTYPWNSNSGTSMSAPVVTGIIALWLQARPDLTREDIIDVLSHTARHPDKSRNYPNYTYGYGEIDAYRGLLYLLGFDGIVSPHMVDGSIFPLREGETMTTYDIQGRRVTEMLPGNIYAVQIKSTDPARCGSMLIRK